MLNINKIHYGACEDVMKDIDSISLEYLQIMSKMKSTRKQEIITKLEEARSLVIRVYVLSACLGSKATYTNTWTIIDAIDEAIRGVEVGEYKK